MRKHIWLIGILVIALLAASFMAGCGKKQQAQTEATAPTAPEQVKGPAGEGANALGDLLAKQSDLTSYVMSMEAGGVKVRYAVKMEKGKPVAMKVDSGPQGWMIMRMDKKIQYIYNPATKSAMAMPMSGAGPQSGPAGKPSAPDAAALRALTGTKVSSETVDGVDCLKVISADGANTYWIEKEHGLPVQVQSGGKTMKFSYEQINSVPDSEFELPPGVKVQEMPKMPQMPK